MMTTRAAKTLPVPRFYEARNAGSWSYQPDIGKLFEAAAAFRAEHEVAPSGSDRAKVHLLLIDVQRDFCFPEGTLYVGGRSGRGAIADSDRIARFVYQNLASLTDLTCTLDTHFPYQIFFPSFWLDRDDRPLSAHREIATADIRRGEVRPNPALTWWLCNGDYGWLCRQVEFYCIELEKAGKYKLYLWPPHCLLGGDGHALVGVVQEARLFHAFVRGSRDGMEVKGGEALTENYSVLAPDGQPLAQRNQQFVETLLGADAVVIAGQAASHCVRSSIEDLLSEIKARDQSLVRKVYILQDCMSAVAVPDPARPGGFIFDFTPQAEAALRRFAEEGMNLVRSSDPIASWPGLRLG
jgi:nicotinamidase-related amidase